MSNQFQRFLKISFRLLKVQRIVKYCPQVGYVTVDSAAAGNRQGVTYPLTHFLNCLGVQPRVAVRAPVELSVPT